MLRHGVAGKLRVPVAAPADRSWRELHERLRAFVRRRVHDEGDADEIAQEVLVRLHQGLPALRDDERLDAFAYAIARNAIIDHYRSRAARREAPTDPAALPEVADDPPGDEPEGRAQLARCLAPLVARLPEPYREALLLTDLGALSQAEAARRLGLSAPGMKSRVQRGRARLGEQLASCCAVSLDAARQIDEVRRVGPCACAADDPRPPA